MSPPFDMLFYKVNENAISVQIFANLAFKKQTIRGKRIMQNLHITLPMSIKCTKKESVVAFFATVQNSPLGQTHFYVSRADV